MLQQGMSLLWCEEGMPNTTKYTFHTCKIEETTRCTMVLIWTLISITQLLEWSLVGECFSVGHGPHKLWFLFLFLNRNDKKNYFVLFNIMQLMTFDEVNTRIDQPTPRHSRWISCSMGWSMTFLLDILYQQQNFLKLYNCLPFFIMFCFYYKLYVFYINYGTYSNLYSILPKLESMKNELGNNRVRLSVC